MYRRRGLVGRANDSGVPPLTVMWSEIVLCELGVDLGGRRIVNYQTIRMSDEIYKARRANDSVQHSRSDSTG